MRSRYGVAYEPEGGWAPQEDAISYADLEAGVGDIASFSRGDSVTGTVLGFEPNGVLIDIGVKSSAYCPIGEAALEKPMRPEDVFDLGASYEFLIVSREDENGQQLLSRRKILTAWDQVSEMMAADKAVEGTVAAVNRGGAIVTVSVTSPPHLPHISPTSPPQELVGQPLKVKFLDVDRENNRLVVSHRKARGTRTINNLNVGSVLAGVVTAVKPYGAFVDLGGMSGLLHISQISCDHISDVASVLPLGAPIKCMVISQDKSKGRVALSTKTLESEPGDMLKKREKVFEEAEATAAKYQERLEAERKAREAAAQDGDLFLFYRLCFFCRRARRRRRTSSLGSSRSSSTSRPTRRTPTRRAPSPPPRTRRRGGGEGRGIWRSHGAGAPCVHGSPHPTPKPMGWAGGGGGGWRRRRDESRSRVYYAAGADGRHAHGSHAREHMPI
ncbi:hypothetical protein EMIHUDRAFT_69198 [Emiliania huxleyi CCMP1516]|uniref:S1 motif domain-containing protein n=2 Tax=Emiliania huxleyi TaxID=2903 RepID=A0A0D3HZH8_EMIH1|nr:hypothetical protein EMIHUDRAFT_69198 [Emiliania huxleyi CCMP1516]EOD04413.1 hypothetical protein EMIHUDRAFT_69198 [Emiliania huxleyi CCMP1516]|eukprot:XP_005756842.1 hypothetical protein EMIHUDRAFT_69198 [Emiliania huxleyi CCMP1516]